MDHPGHTHRQFNTGLILALISGLAYSSEAVVAKLLFTQGFEPLAILSWRYFLAAIILALWSRSRYPALEKAVPLHLMAVLGLSQAATALFLYYAFSYIPVGLAVFCFFLYPALVTLLELIFFAVRPRPNRLFALALTLTGLLIIAGPAMMTVSWPGFFWAVAAAASNALFLIASSRSPNNLPAVKVSAVTAGWSVPLFFLAAWAAKTPLLVRLTGCSLLLLLFLVLVPSVLALTCLLGAIFYLGASRAAIITTAEPFFTALLGFFILGSLIYLWY